MSRSFLLVAAAVMASCALLAPFDVPDGGHGEPEDGGEPDDCEGIVCPPDSSCELGVCITLDACRSITCADGFVCAQGACVNALLDEDGDGFVAASDCDDHDPSVIPGSLRACATSCAPGTTTCQEGVWQPCTAPTSCSCEPGEAREEACGRCGAARRLCEASGSWGELGPCEDQGECSAGAVGSEVCGGAGACSTRTQTCSDQCEWGPFGACVDLTECVPGETGEEACGSCGEWSRSCTARCLWGSFSACSGQGDCPVGTVEERACGTCGTQSRTCSAECEWGGYGACEGEGVCTPGDVRTEGCGNCGTHSGTCQANCSWGAYGACGGEGACSPGESEDQGCGLCGSQSRGCQADCTWGAFGACLGEGPCAPNTTRGCGNCGTSTCQSSCQWGGCANEGPCGAGQSRSCADGCGTETCEDDCSGWTACSACSCPSIGHGTACVGQGDFITGTCGQCVAGSYFTCMPGCVWEQESCDCATCGC